MNLDEFANRVKNNPSETPDAAQKLIGDWENIVLLMTPCGCMIFESEAQVDKFMRDNPGFFPADVPFIPMKKGRVYHKDGKAYADFEDFTLHF